MTGTGTASRRMLQIPFSDEHSPTEHLNTFWYDTTGAPWDTMEQRIDRVHNAGGISRINHPGRWTGTWGSFTHPFTPAPPVTQTHVNKYVNLFLNYPVKSLVGMEIINKTDHESQQDRILWDRILMETMPGRPVWGFSDDDSHDVTHVGSAFNIFLIDPTDFNTNGNNGASATNQAQLNAQSANNPIRRSMVDGSFYAVSRVAHIENVNRGEGIWSQPIFGIERLLNQPTPRITRIDVDHTANTIIIQGTDFTTVEWIADGNIIETGNTINLDEHRNNINNYVRVQLRSATGIAFAQPFGIIYN